jgi:cysteine desulfurase/selenocysteine lyase
MSLTPAPVVDRVRTHLDLEAELGGYEAAVAVADELAAIPAALAPLLGARPDEVLATESATRAWELALWSLAETFGWSAGDRIVVDQFAYATVYTTLMGLHRAHGVEVAVIPAVADGRLDADALSDLLDRDSAGAIRMVVVTHMPTHLGTVTDAEDVGRRLAGRGILYALDISQTLGQYPVDVSRFGCDIAFAPGRKFLRAPRGTAVLYVNAAVADQLIPLALPSGAVDPHDPERLVLAPAMRRFDQFEYPVAAHLGLGEAARYAQAIGMNEIARRVAENSRAVIDLLGAFDDVTLTGTPDDLGIISFVHRTLDPETVQRRVSAEGVNVWVNPAGGAPLDNAARPVLPSVRVSPHYVTTTEHLDRLVGALDKAFTSAD